MSLRTITQRVETAEALNSLEFYVSAKLDNKPAKLHCRLWENLISLPSGELDAIARELNDAIRPVLERRAKGLLMGCKREIDEALK